MPRWLLKFAIVVLVTALTVGDDLSASQPGTETKKHKTAVKKLPFPGEVFLVDGCPAFLIPPTQSSAGRTTPWVWYCANASRPARQFGEVDV